MVGAFFGCPLADLLGDVGVTLDELSLVECGAGADERDQVGALTARHRSWAACNSLKAIARPPARLSGRLVARVRSRTVERPGKL